MRGIIAAPSFTRWRVRTRWSGPATMANPQARLATRKTRPRDPTAGQPMLDVLRGSGMLDIAAVVVRYFGGVKLGTGGLVRAYSDAVSLVLPEVPRVRRQQLTVWALAVPHAQAGRLEAELRATTARTRIEIVGVDYGAEATLRVAAADDDALLHTVASLTKGSVQPECIGASWIEVSDYTG